MGMGGGSKQMEMYIVKLREIKRDAINKSVSQPELLINYMNSKTKIKDQILIIKAKEIFEQLKLKFNKILVKTPERNPVTMTH